MRGVGPGVVLPRPERIHARLVTVGQGSLFALVFFPVAYILMHFFVLNLFISVILENFYEIDMNYGRYCCLVSCARGIRKADKWMDLVRVACQWHRAAS